MSYRTLVLAGAALIGLSGFTTSAAQAANVADTLASDARFSKFVDLIQRAGLTPALKSAGRMTVFAPTNDAFNRAPADMIAMLSPQGGNQNPNSNSAQLQSLIRIHLLDAVYPPASFIGKQVEVVDEAGTRLRVDGSQSGVLAITTVTANVGGPNVAGATTARRAQVVGQELNADNGVIYPIDNVLIQ